MGKPKLTRVIIVAVLAQTVNSPHNGPVTGNFLIHDDFFSRKARKDSGHKFRPKPAIAFK